MDGTKENDPFFLEREENSQNFTWAASYKIGGHSPGEEAKDNEYKHMGFENSMTSLEIHAFATYGIGVCECVCMHVHKCWHVSVVGAAEKLCGSRMK